MSSELLESYDQIRISECFVCVIFVCLFVVCVSENFRPP